MSGPKTSAPEPSAWEVVYYLDSPGGTRTRNARVTYEPDYDQLGPEEGEVTEISREPLYTEVGCRKGFGASYTSASPGASC